MHPQPELERIDRGGYEIRDAARRLDERELIEGDSEDDREPDLFDDPIHLPQTPDRLVAELDEEHVGVVDHSVLGDEIGGFDMGRPGQEQPVEDAF